MLKASWMELVYALQVEVDMPGPSVIHAQKHL